MANKRFFNKLLCEADVFTDLPDKTQLLYYHLNFNADDEGFIDNAKIIMAMSGTNKKHLQALIDVGYIIKFESGVYLIAHWWIHNKHDMRDMKPTTHTLERNLVEVEETTRQYFFKGTAPRRDSDGRLNNNIQDNNKKDYITTDNLKYDQSANNLSQKRKLIRLEPEESIIDYLTIEERNDLYSKYTDTETLLEIADDTLYNRETEEPIAHPYQYLKAIASNYGWN